MLQTATEVRHVESVVEIFSKRCCEGGGPAPRSGPLMQMENLMKSLSTIAVAVLLIATPACFAQQVVGSTTVGVAYAELRDVTTGWSTKRQVLGKNVFNDKGETIGKIDDIIVAPDKAVSYAIIGAGGFLGVGRHDVAIPVGQLKENGGKFILPGGSKDAIKALPEFEYAHNQ